MNLPGLILIAASVPNTIMGLFVLTRNPRNKVNFFFSMFALSVSLWSLGLAGYLFTSDLSHALAWAQLYYSAAAVIAVTFVLFSLFYKSEEIPFTKQHALLLIPPLLLISLIVGVPDFLTTEVAMRTWGKEVLLATGGYAAYCVYFVAYVCFGFAMIVRKFLRAKGVQRVNLKYIFVGLVVAFSLGMLFNLVLPFFGNYRYIWAGPPFTVVYVAMIGYAIIKHGMFDIRLAAVRTLAYALSLATLAGIYTLVALWVSQEILGYGSTAGQNAVNITTALLLAFIFQPVKRFFDKATNRIFYKDQYDTDEFIARLSEVLTTTTDLRSLLQRAAIEIGNTLKSEQAFFYVNYSDDRHLSAGTGGYTSFTVSQIDELNKDMAQEQRAVIVVDLLPNSSATRRILDSRSVAVLMPIYRGGHRLGYLALGAQRSSGYAERDIRVLETISNELLIAIQNALSTQEVRDINTHLQERIKEATHELTRSNAQLKKLDKSKDEFISMASHQLRTPLTAVKGYISMVLDGDMGKITNEQRNVLEQAFESSQRMAYLIGDFLNVSRLQTGKFELELSSIDITSLVREEVGQLVDTARTRRITLEYDQPSETYTIQGDNNKLRQVMMNFIDNAIYYSRADGKVTVQLLKEPAGLVFKVIDTGIGVPPAERPKLFTKFFRATNARQQRPDGTGIGLYMAKKVVLAHGGTIIFETTEGKGSTFGFKLPLSKDQLK